MWVWEERDFPSFRSVGKRLRRPDDVMVGLLNITESKHVSPHCLRKPVAQQGGRKEASKQSKFKEIHFDYCWFSA